MIRVAVIGDLDSVIGFRGLGMTVIATDQADVAAKEIEQLAKRDYGVIFLSEALVAQDPQLVETYRNQLQPAVILIPSTRGGTGEAMTQLRELVKRAVGMDLLKDPS